MPGIETSELIEPWLYRTLSTDPTIASLVADRVYGALTPEEINDVYVNFQVLSPRDVRGVGRARFQVEAIYMVQAVAQTTSQTILIPIARRIDQLLEGVDADVPGGHITCVRETILSRPQVISDAGQVRGGGQAFWHLGATYRIWASFSTP